MNIYPIQFGFPDNKVCDLKIHKDMFFSDLSPRGNAKKYIFFKEKEYYQHYSRAYFAVTIKKGGWDCLRHYEILASGTIPYFIDIEKCPEKTLFNWPKDLLLEAQKIKGMPSKTYVKWSMKSGTLNKIKMSNSFDLEHYGELLEKLKRAFFNNLTTARISEYLIKKMNNPKKVLLLFGIHSSAIDYQRDTIIEGLINSNLTEVDVYPYPIWHRSDCHRQFLNTLYGRGFTCTANIHPEKISNKNWDEIWKNINLYDQIVVFTSSNKSIEALPDEVKTKLLESNLKFIWIDGNDIKADHSIPKNAKMVFRRELS